MSLVRALYCSVGGSFGMLLLAATALAQADITTGSIGTNSVETSSIDMSAIDSLDECMVAQICIDRYLWSLYERTRKIDTIKVPELTFRMSKVQFLSNFFGGALVGVRDRGAPRSRRAVRSRAPKPS